MNKTSVNTRLIHPEKAWWHRPLPLAVGLSLLIIVSVLIAVYWGGVQPDRIEDLARSPFLFVFRVSIYTLIWFKSESLLKQINSVKVDKKSVARVRRTLIVVFIFYEFLASGFAGILHL